MSELVRSSVAETIGLLYGLIANPEAIAKFTVFFNKIDGRRFVMTINEGRHENKRLGVVVTITAHDNQCHFELLQGFLPLAEEMFHATGKRFFTDFFEPEFGSVVQTLADVQGYN